MTSDAVEPGIEQPSNRDSLRSYDLLLERIAAERKYQSDVFGWFLGLNGFLFAALGFAWKDVPPLIFLIGALGLMSATSWWVGSTLTAMQIRKFRFKATDRAAQDVEESWVLMAHDIPPSMRTLMQFLQPTVALPIFLGATRAAVIVVGTATQ